MISQLEAIDEYNNVGALFGLDGVEGLDGDAELMGILGRIKNPVRRKRFINKMAMPGISSKGSRAEMEKHFNELPAHIKEGLKKGELRLADAIMLAISAGLIRMGNQATTGLKSRKMLCSIKLWSYRRSTLKQKSKDIETFLMFTKPVLHSM